MQGVEVYDGNNTDLVITEYGDGHMVFEYSDGIICPFGGDCNITVLNHAGLRLSTIDGRNANRLFIYGDNALDRSIVYCPSQDCHIYVEGGYNMMNGAQFYVSSGFNDIDLTCEATNGYTQCYADESHPILHSDTFSCNISLLLPSTTYDEWQCVTPGNYLCTV